MGSSKLKRAIGAVKDQTSVGLAKVGGRSSSLTELEIAVVKATRHDDYPAEDKYIREILCLTSYSRNYVSACVATLSRRLNKTKNWSVALKTLILIQRLLTDGDRAYEQEIFFATRRGTRLLNMSDFRDASQSDSWDYSAFVRTYALYLDERLDYRMQGRRGKKISGGGGGDGDSGEEDDHRGTSTDIRSKAIVVKSKPVAEMKTEKIFNRVQHLQQLLDRFLACRPTGNAKNNRVVIVAMYPIVKESFQLYYNITEIMGVLIERFMELDIHDSIKVYEIFCRVSKQFDELDPFYGWCKNMGVARSSEYPELEKITQKKLDLMDEFIRDKSALAAQTTKSSSKRSNKSEEEESKTEYIQENQEDLNSIKALPAPEQKEEEEEEEKMETKKDVEEVVSRQDQEGDLLDLTDEAGVTAGTVGDSLALALFDGAVGTESASGPGWEAFNDNSADWETDLVKSATRWSGQKSELGGGFDTLLLDGMYQYGAVNAAVKTSTAYGSSGSASSVAFGSAGSPAASMLALPAPPPTANGNRVGNNSPVMVDPFAASLEVAPPAYVQMNDMEKKQRLLMEEQIMWDQYNRSGRQGHMNFGQNQQQQYYQLPYSMGPYSYTPRY
ncbi:AP180 N-terminal homology (ANTH) domain protein [Arabidopsis suecica]|uniref:AP180 N-terminal homology (ANTH) domain protein n=1 Tax=Arabidopsis suecica TaxID=45249 RepID=A0A8T2E5B7_ARASU|nr:AP180 N-terminal homology (ANTH) domain protein [Arabidopsis suecica]